MPLEHIHTWIQWKRQVGRKKFLQRIKGEPAYQCADPNCNSFKPRSRILGTNAICYFCKSNFAITCENSLLSVPRCLACRTTKKGLALREAKQLLESLYDGGTIKEVEEKEENVLE